MRSKAPLKLAITLTAVYVLYLGVTNRLGLYIHPRYEVFTLVMAGIALLMALASQSTDESHAGHTHDKEGVHVSIPLAVVLLVALVLPAQSLSSSTVSQRSTDAGSLVATTETEPISTLFAGSSKGLGVTDWARLLNANTDPAYYVNKPANFSGFVYDAGLGDDAVWLGRFIVTCCAVDAQPVGVPIELPSWASQYEQDQWLEVAGEFEVRQTLEGEQLILIPTSVTAIDEPENPYAY